LKRRVNEGLYPGVVVRVSRTTGSATVIAEAGRLELVVFSPDR
jgi:hypothetical protein